MMNAWVDYDLTSLRRQLADWGAKPAHAVTLMRAFYGAAGELDLDTLEIGRALRDRIRQEIRPRRSRVLARRESKDQTVKLLVGFDDWTDRAGMAAEAVLMPAYQPDRAAACVSSQIGCAMGCDFCASTRGGLQRNLEPGEIVEQFLHLRREAEAASRRITSLVFMGIGEPMHNFDNVVAAIKRIADPAMGGLGWRQVTVSTVGIVSGIDRLAQEDLNVHLAVSLHAPDDATRAQIMPAGRRYGVAEVLSATRRFWEKTKRIPTIEYCLLAGVNDSDEQARLLASLLRGWKVHVNLIPYNAIGPGLSGRVYERSSTERMYAFAGVLRSGGAVAHFRRTRGDDVDAACGQLRFVSRDRGGTSSL